MVDNTQRVARARELSSVGKMDAAAALYRSILSQQPKNLDAAKGLSNLVETGAVVGDASETRKAVIEIETEGAYSVAKMAQTQGRFDVAIRCYKKILNIAPEHGDAVWGLAEAYYGNKNLDEALHWYRRYAEIYPKDPESEHMVAALGEGPKPLRASDAYVRETFDHFAEDFDQQLLEDLEYKAPELIYGLFKRLPLATSDDLHILDAGCGTGLSGIDFKSHSAILTGIDLSPEMLKYAKDRNIYDELLESEVANFMRDHPNNFDIIIAVDVFCYIGDLSETLKAAEISLTPGGYLIFSVEAQSKRGYSLTGSGRYAHKPAYVRKTAYSAGLQEKLSLFDTLRTEYGASVNGYLTALQKPA
ncbi:MAG: Ubiquinone biosynthesis O-methyltransferase [Alphaproteobacteria bacterium MarineAlpha11_Bin1]|nr:MAG: Ubiquinone biosynthesis O-methyltransferase [Alphaproteobacteria bacterium MarineAlpha11_Bin1]|tara:strand:- start:1612 stop:2694 length:1083 start_codon:yes stop_codon:yes gene_type:complete